MVDVKLCQVSIGQQVFSQQSRQQISLWDEQLNSWVPTTSVFPGVIVERTSRSFGSKVDSIITVLGPSGVYFLNGMTVVGVY